MLSRERDEESTMMIRMPKQSSQESVKMFKTLFLASLFLTLMLNIVFLFATKDKPPDLSKQEERMEANITRRRLVGGGGGDDDKRLTKKSDSRDADGNNQQVRAGTGDASSASSLDKIISCDNERTLHIRVKSSKNHVFVSANNLIIYESKSAAAAQHHHKVRRFNDADASLSDHKAKSKLVVGVDNSIFSQEDDDAAAAAAENEDAADERGIHVVVLNEFNGLLMAKRVFDTYSPGQDDELSAFIETIRDGRLLVFAIRDEASFKMANNSSARYLLQILGSKHIMKLGWRDMWAFVAQKKSRRSAAAAAAAIDDEFLRGTQISNSSRLPVTFAEGLMKSSKSSDWAPAVVLDASLRLSGTGCSSSSSSSQLVDPTSLGCKWGAGISHEDRRRLAFCSKVEGYAGVCDCKHPVRIEFNPAKLTNSQLSGVPIVVMASNRPYYLFRMLRSLLKADGVNSSMVTVFIDGYYEDPLRVSQLFNLRTVQHAPVSRRSARISHHYKSSLTITFDTLFPEAEFAIIFEEDLDIAPDIMVYFNRTLDLLRRDSSLYCSSAWNDQGYEHSTGGDSGLLYRIETMPGLGWMLSRKLFKQELEPNWPAADQPHDWDMWIRTQSVRKHRECIIPDISRTFHFGAIGTNINSYFQTQYFSKHAFLGSGSELQRAQFKDLDKLTKEAYELHMQQLISEAECIDHNSDYLCSLASSKSNVNVNNATSSVIYIEMIDEHDFSNWLKLAKCWRIWDLDARGQHKSMWRLFLRGQPLFVVGVPASPYAKFKPAHVTPLAL